MLRLAAFDLDDTLAPSKSPLDPRMSDLLGRLLDVCEVCVISGGSFEQFTYQLIASLPAGARLDRLHLMPTCGTRYYRWDGAGWERAYAENLTDDERDETLAVVEEEASRLGFWTEKTWGPALEDRGSQITYSALGQSAPIETKAAWDPDGTKRISLRAAVQARLPGLAVRAGGSTSLDITRRGVDKAYGMTKLASLSAIPFSDMLFVGDRLDPDGNDHPVIALGIRTHAVADWTDTAALIEGRILPELALQPVPTD